jgi:hypothetical protein
MRDAFVQEPGGMSPINRPVHFAGAVLPVPRHICAFFPSLDDEARVQLPFVQEGLDRAEKIYYVVDPALRDEYRQRMQAAGIDLPALEQSGQLELRTWDEVYLREGRFDQDRALALIEEVMQAAEQQGFNVARIAGHGDWASENHPGVDDFFCYEARLNDLQPRYGHPIICLYDAARFSGDAIVDILRIHPMVLLGGTLRENPFYLPPAQFLREMEERRANLPHQ